MGAECRARQRRRSVQRLGRPAQRDAGARRLGVWEAFIAAIGVGSLYKYEIRTRDGRLLLKSDPYGFAMQLRPDNASIVASLDGFVWNDASWLGARAAQQCGAPAVQRLRGASRFVAAALGSAQAAVHELERGDRTADSLRHGPGLHAYRTDGRRRASPRCLLGLSGHGLFCADLALRLCAGFHALRRCLPPGAASA
jgi:hypothetical protein